MTTTNIKAFKSEPYYDDYFGEIGDLTNVETKNYHRILFRPGYAVQARELTQLQTMLQAQIDRHGQYAFKDGSRVVNGELSLNIEYDYLKVEASFVHSSVTYTSADLQSFVGTIITGTSSSGNQVTATVLQAVSAVDASNPDTLYIRYLKSGDDVSSGTNTVDKFGVGEVFQSNASPVKYGMVGGGSNVNGTNDASNIANAVGQGSSVSISEGVYFISGCFVYVGASTIILDKYSNNPSYIIGLQIAENEVSSSTDASLVDNAQGVPNTSAPGANRYQIATTLIKQPIDIDSRTVDKYITLLTVDNGLVTVDKTDKTQDTGLTLRLAQRTHDESGDYVVQPFELEILEHLNNSAGNFGKYSAAEGGSADKIALGIEPSTAYVKGYRNHKVGTTYLDVEKPRGSDATAFQNESNTQINIGNYVKLSLTGLTGIPDLENFSNIVLKAAASSVGTARVRGMEAYSDHARLYLFDIVMSSGTFNAVDNVSQATYGFAANFVAADDGTRFDVGHNTCVFQLPQTAIKTLADPSRDTTYSIKRIFQTATSSTGTLSFSTSVGLFEDVSDIIIAPTGGATIKTGQSGNITSGGNGTTGITYSAATAIGNNVSCNIIATVKKTIAPKSKTKVSVSKTINVTNGNYPAYNLDKSDIISITSITDFLGVDQKANFTLDNGQRDNFYDEGKIIKKAGTAALPTGNMVVIFEHYEHGAGDYFCVDSYPTADYSIIPSFSGSSGNLELRDCIDFRPTKSSSGSPTTGSEFSTGTGFSLSGAPKVGHALTADINYYLPRTDKLIMKRDGAFEIIKGVPSEYPQPPADKEDGLTLYQLKLSPYVFSLSDVAPEMQDNKRYTMKDIGKLDKRIKNLEYYTSLSLLEQSAADIHMVDVAGLSRFKNGIVVDSFKDQSVADMTHPECSESIDKQFGLLRPECPTKNVNLITKSSASNTAVKKSSNWTMAHTEVEHTKQPYASVAINVNPYAVFSWAGRVQLSPESDEWKETEIRPDIVIDDNGQYDQFVARAEEEGILGTVWNEWETNWAGRQIETELVSAGFTGRTRTRRGGSREFQTVTATTVTDNQSRSGLRTEVAFDTVTKETGNRIVETNFVPFMRSRKIYFKASRMKPNTKVYAFFNDVNVTTYCKEEAYQEWSDTTGVVQYPGATTHPDGASDLITNNKGQITGSFVIPRNSVTKFKSGTKEFRLSDSSTGARSLEATSAETQFHSQGLIESTQRTVVSTKVPRLEISRVNDARVVSETFNRTVTTWIDPLAQSILIEKSGGIFVTSLDLYFESKYTIKTGDDAEIPVCVSIVTTENGIPTQTVIPGTEVELFPGSVNVSSTAATATTFTFDYPVYLLQDQEYAIVIQSDCDEYKAWVAEMGGLDVTNANYRINKQPHGGSFFTSQNASTWTPDQSKDLKFTLKRAKFTNSSEEVTFVNDANPVKLLKPDALSTTSGSGVITVRHKNHAMHGTTSSVVISGAITFNGIDATNINGTHTISNITHDTYSITALNSDTASAAGSGGGSLITATENIQIDVSHLVAATAIVPSTDIRFYLTSTSQRSIDGAQTPYSTNNEIEIKANMNEEYSNPLVISSTANESGGAKTFTLRAVLTTTRDHLTPVLDANRLSVITVQNRIGDNGTVVETNAYGGSELCKYITKKIDLAEEADVINVYLSSNRPSGSSIDFYYRTVPSGSDVDFNSIAWIQASPVDAIPINDDQNIYNESKYAIDPTGTFGSMAFKIILRSKNSARPPTVKDFRAIAAT
tara:strand:+ start:678 stop:5942 length:5265 start_codon:yes stop_codon:yes gene_type:complete